MRRRLYPKINRSRLNLCPTRNRGLSEFYLAWGKQVPAAKARYYLSTCERTFVYFDTRHDRAEAKSRSTLRPAAAIATPATLAVVQHTPGRRSATSSSWTKSCVWRTRHAIARQSHRKSKISCRQSSVISLIVPRV